MVRSSVRSLAGILSACVFFSACDQREAVDPGSNTGGPRFFVSITADSDSLDVASTLQLTANVVDALGQRADQGVTWSSLSPDVATVDGIGLVTGVAAGPAAIVARVGSGALLHADTAHITVRERIAALTITPELAEITLGDSLQLEATMSTPSGANIRGLNVRWTTSDQAIAPISEEGIVSSLSPGDVTLTAIVNGVTATAYARVLPNPIQNVSVSPANSGLNPGESVQLQAVVRDSRGRIIRTDVAWTSSSPAVARVTPNGVVTGMAKGAAMITASVANRRASATVNVFAVPAANVVVSTPSSSVTQGGRMKATATVRDADGNLLTNRAVAWSSSNPAVAQIGADGTITGLVVGTTTINAIVDSKIGSLPISGVGAAASTLAVMPA
ncbi:MAG: Ig-like domain-containing protein, partial [Gemmatimonadota bacterium]